MFVTIVDILIFVLCVGAAIAAYVYLRGMFREQLTQDFILHNAYEMNDLGGFMYVGMSVSVDEGYSRSPKVHELDETTLDDVIQQNYRAAELLSWGWPVMVPLTKYRIRQAIELAQIRLDIEDGVYATDRKRASAFESISSESDTDTAQDDSVAPEDQIDATEHVTEVVPPLDTSSALQHNEYDDDGATETKVLETVPLQELPLSNGQRDLDATQEYEYLTVSPRTEELPLEDDDTATDQNAKIQHLADNILTTLQQDPEDTAEEERLAQERVEQRSKEIQEQLKVERSRGFLK